MAIRNRTRLFLKYRTSGGGETLDTSTQAEGSDSQFIDPDEKLDVVERNALPPEWVDIVDKIEDELKSVERKVRSLSAAYEARLKVSFNDTIKQDSEIQMMTKDITMLFRNADTNLKRIATIGTGGGNLPYQERVVRLNVMRSLARKIQSASKGFKNKQKAFMMRKQRQDGYFEGEGMDDEEIGEQLNDEQMEQMMQLDKRADQRQKDIERIVESIRELNQIFRDMSILVVEQGTVLDRIDYHVEQAHQRVVAGNVELVKANEYSASASKKFWWCFFILLIMIIILLGVVVNKFMHK
uniref:t-SNARE coiled-coil homology domain-containing protein n=1 Tax=Amorphochlora amoebiformis TaxID=1561963 RepID=A0A7S0GYM2_9EUKA|mmetsp:Transcript_27380/g.43460  ORF Transcript_27380/g.43460 Transcript_27380/m.43460 type:complete len:297 (+) Transcript_27380:37-927(+)